MKKTQFWEPDTCGCKFEEEWDTDDPEAPRVPLAVTPCPEHAPIAASAFLERARVDGPQAPGNASAIVAAVYSTALDENRRKNLVFKRAVESIPELTFKDADGNEHQRVDAFEWAFDENRNLEYVLTRGTPAQRAAAQSEVTKQFGGKARATTKANLDARRKRSA